MDKVLENMEKMPRFLVCFLNCKNLYFYIFFSCFFKQLHKCVPFNLHGGVTGIKHDAVLVIIYIG